ncbi:MAG TPA: hypothetical protein VII94_02170 [Candidatus Saccharimonadales bacterium]
MVTKINWSITDQNVGVNYEGQTHIVSRTDVLADRLIKAIKENRLSEIPALVSAAKRIELFSDGNFSVKNGQVIINGIAVSQVLSNKIVKFSNEGLPYQPLVKFAENLQKNPSYRAVQELFQFLEKNDHPLTENGNFIAYKRVKGDFKDIHSGTFDNSVGITVEIPRNQVDEDSARTCSHGLHVANWTYAHTQFASYDPSSDIMLEVEVNPADVVAIPTDYNQSKMRVCKYVVLGVVTTPFDPTTSLRITKPQAPSCEVADGCYAEEEEEECTCEADFPEDCTCSCEECLFLKGECEKTGSETPDYCDKCFEPDCYGECDDPYPYDDELEE